MRGPCGPAFLCRPPRLVNSALTLPPYRRRKAYRTPATDHDLRHRKRLSLPSDACPISSPATHCALAVSRSWRWRRCFSPSLLTWHVDDPSFSYAAEGAGAQPARPARRRLRRSRHADPRPRRRRAALPARHRRLEPLPPARAAPPAPPDARLARRHAASRRRARLPAGARRLAAADRSRRRRRRPRSRRCRNGSPAARFRPALYAALCVVARRPVARPALGRPACAARLPPPRARAQKSRRARREEPEEDARGRGRARAPPPAGCALAAGIAAGISGI